MHVSKQPAKAHTCLSQTCMFAVLLRSNACTHVSKPLHGSSLTLNAMHFLLACPLHRNAWLKSRSSARSPFWIEAALAAQSPLAPAGACVAALVGVAPPQRHCRGRSLGMRWGGGTLLVPSFGAILGREGIGGLSGLCAQVGHALQEHILTQDGVTAVLAALLRTQRCLAPEGICTAALCITAYAGDTSGNVSACGSVQRLHSHAIPCHGAACQHSRQQQNRMLPDACTRSNYRQHPTSS